MSKQKKPSHKPVLPFPTTADTLHREGDWLWIPLRREWRTVTAKPEEIVRQRFIRVLFEHYGYSLDQMDQERRTQHGHKSPRADIVIWQSVTDKTANRAPVLVAECKTDSIEIQDRDYYQGESYTRAVGCEFFIATNTRHTAIFRLVPGLPGEFVAINEIPKADDWGDAKRLKKIRESLRAFNRKEFQDLLFNCHSILRDVHKMDPGRAFDTISKVLFIKMYVERTGLHGTFTTEYLDRRATSRMPNDPLVHDGLFDLTKDHYKSDDLFASTDKLDISEQTFRRIVKELDTRVGRLAWKCIYGTDAEQRAARTAKMNMIMHGDGHGGIHYHDGLLDINGIFNNRFDLVFTNPPFGSNVGSDQKVGGSDETRVPTDQAYTDRCHEHYGEYWAENHQRLLQAAEATDSKGRKGTPILDLFEIGKGKNNRPTELIFVERCLNLLRPGGRMGIVLPDGNLNNPSLAWLRRWAEGKAKLLAVVSLPEETFRSSNATVKASLVFLHKFTAAEATAWETAWIQVHGELDSSFDRQRNTLYDQYASRIVGGDDVENARQSTARKLLGYPSQFHLCATSTIL
jgi:Type I restriction enzyme R protein N terminus (HSDR_N)/N-6 DNA Methylase